MEQTILNTILTKVTAMEKRMGNFVTQDQFESRFDKVVMKLIDIDERLKTFATKDELQAVRNEMTNGFDAMAHRFSVLEQEYAFTRVTLDRHEERISEIEGTLAG